MLPILNKDCIVTDVSAAEKNDIIREMAGCLDRAGYLSDVEQFYQDVLEREMYSRHTSAIRSDFPTARAAA